MNVVDISKSRNNIVKKHNDLIKAKGALSQTAQKMLAMLIGMIRVDDTEFQKYALHINTYKKEIDSTSKKSTKDYTDQALELMRNPFYIMENNKRKFFNWCSMVEPDEIDGYVIFQIHPELKPYLLELKKEIGGFTQYFLVNILNLKGKYSPRLYEYFISQWKQYKHYNKSSTKYTFELELSEMKDTLGLNDKKYRYNDIKKQIIEKAKEDFRKYTDIQFEYEEKKIGRRVDSILFTIYDNNKGSNDYLNSRQDFIAYIRDKYKPDTVNEVFPTIIEASDNYKIKIDFKGKLYATKAGKLVDFNNKEADQFWNEIYQKAKNGYEF